MKMRRHLLILLTIFLVSFFIYPCFSDVVYFDNQKVEGRIVEETPTTLVLETIIGKVTIDKSKVVDIRRTRPEDDFLNMGNYYFKQKRYDAAIDYYNRALEANPDFDKAKKALEKIRKIKRQEEMRRQLELERIKKEREKIKEKLEKKIGIAVDKIDSQFKVVHIVENSPSARAGIKLYDRIISIEGACAKDMTFENICGLLMGKPPISLTIEREISLIRKRINYKKRTYVGIGIFLIEGEEEYLVTKVIKGSPADKADMKVQDRIIEIDGRPCKSLSLDEIEELMTGGELTTVNIIIQRNVRIK